MRKFSTRCMNSMDNNDKSSPAKANTNPRKSTVDFLRQFARIYHVEPILPQRMCGYLLN